MMSIMRIGICNLPPAYYVTGPTTVDGIFAPIIRLIIMSLMTEVNITLIDTENCKNEKCFENGTCVGPPRDLQIGKADYILETYYNLLGDLGTNLTTGSIFSENACYLAHKRKFKLNLDYSNFLDIIDSFDSYFWPMLILSFGSLCITLGLFINRKTTSTINIFWTQLLYILCQNRGKLFGLTRKQNLVIFILSLLLISKLLSSSLQTGLISKPEFIELKTLDDIIKYDYQPIAFKKSECRHELQIGLDSIEKRHSSQVTIETIPDLMLADFYNFVKFSKHVTICTQDWSRVIKSIGCLLFREYEMNEPFEKSNSPISNSFKGVLINKYAEPKVNRILIRRSYSSFENGLGHNELSAKLYAKCLGVDNTPISCFDSKLEAKGSVIPITLNYLLIPLLIMISCYSIALLLVLINHFRDS